MEAAKLSLRALARPVKLDTLLLSKMVTLLLATKSLTVLCVICVKMQPVRQVPHVAAAVVVLFVTCVASYPPALFLKMWVAPL